MLLVDLHQLGVHNISAGQVLVFSALPVPCNFSAVWIADDGDHIRLSAIHKRPMLITETDPWDLVFLQH